MRGKDSSTKRHAQRAEAKQPYTRVPHTGSAPFKHRQLIEELAQTKVDYIGYIENIKLDSIKVQKIIDETVHGAYLNPSRKS